MAAVSSAWSKPGAWALESESQETPSDFPSLAAAAAPAADFPSLTAAAATKPSKKKKAQTLTLAQFTTAPTTTEPLALPTGPRERSAEELARGPRGFSSFDRSSRRNGFEDSGNPRAPPRDSEYTPSRADEADDWGTNKRSVGPLERRRERGTAGLFDSNSRADDSDSWVSNKSSVAPILNRSGFDRERRSGYDFRKESSGADSETWGRRRESFNDSDSFGQKRDTIDSWKKEEPASGNSRPRLVLQPRSLPLSNVEEEKVAAVVAKEAKSVNSNPFGAARPREEVLKEKGQDWKEIDDKLEAMKVTAPVTAGKKGFVNGAGREDRTTMAWRKPTDVSLLGEYKAEETVAEN